MHSNKHHPVALVSPSLFAHTTIKRNRIPNLLTLKKSPRSISVYEASEAELRPTRWRDQRRAREQEGQQQQQRRQQRSRPRNERKKKAEASAPLPM